MSSERLDRVVREAGGHIVAALAARYRDLDVAEEAFAEACARAVEVWDQTDALRDPAAWLYRTASRCALDAFRRRRIRERDPPSHDVMPAAVAAPLLPGALDAIRGRIERDACDLVERLPRMDAFDVTASCSTPLQASRRRQGDLACPQTMAAATAHTVDWPVRPN